MNLRGQDSTSMVDVKKRAAQYAKIASFLNADPDEIGKTLAKHPTLAIVRRHKKPLLRLLCY
jgi:cell division septal protein FtsQ